MGATLLMVYIWEVLYNGLMGKMQMRFQCLSYLNWLNTLFVNVKIDEEFGEAEEEVEVESDEAEQGGEDEEENGDFIDSEFEQSDEEDNMNFHRYVVTEEQDDGHN
ncbi:unnamed protein product [Prunus brigantina]